MIERFRRLAQGRANVDFVGRARTWAIVSGVIIVVSLIGILGPGLRFSLEFEGGSALIVTIRNDAEVPDLQEVLASAGIEGTVQVRTRPTGEREALVRSKETAEQVLAEVQRGLAIAAGQVGTGGEPLINEVSRTTIGPTWGQQITSKAIRGLIVFLILVSVYISFRFEPKMAVGALAALAHDLTATAGIYALVGFEVSPATVIALLTLMGYSLYDTVVVYDRINENASMLTATSKTTYSGVVNRSLNEVLMRSINTSISTLLPIGGILFVGVFLFGAVTLKDLALAMFIGSIAGTYSSVFVAAPLLAVLKEREPQNQALRRRLEGKTAEPRARRAERPAAEAPGEGSAPAEDLEPATPTRTTPPARRPGGPTAGPPRPPRKRRGKRRGKRR